MNTSPRRDAPLQEWFIQALIVEWWRRYRSGGELLTLSAFKLHDIDLSRNDDPPRPMSNTICNVEPNMPTTIPAVINGDVNTQVPLGRIHAILNNRDLLAVALFAAIGLALTPGFAVFCPLSTQLTVLASGAS